MTASCAFSQSLELTPRGLNEFCTDSTGLRAIARLKLNYQLLLQQNGVLDTLYRNSLQLQALEEEQRQLCEAQLHLAQAQLHSARRQRWYYAGGGFALALLIFSAVR